MTEEFNQILDECIDWINSGEDLESCLANYPEYADELRLFLSAMVQTKSVYSFTPSNITKAEARQRFNAALKELRQRRQARQPLSERFLGWSKVWATAAVVVVIAVAVYFGLRLTPSSPEAIPEPRTDQIITTMDPDSSITPQPSPEGNFVFLISDEANAIDDFVSLNLTISGIGLLPDGSDRWFEFEPEVNSVDLTTLQGNEKQEIWRGNVAQGSYTNVFIYVSEVTGILNDKEDADSVEVKLPSGKLHLSIPFQVSAHTITYFTYDITVVSTGSTKNGPKYILKPVVGESGAEVQTRTGREKQR